MDHGEIQQLTRIGHVWKKRQHSKNSFVDDYFCIRRGCRKVVSDVAPPTSGICAGSSEIVKEMVSPRLTRA